MGANHLNSGSDLTQLESVVCGGVAGLLTRFAIAPLDLLKIRLQLNRKETSWRVVSGVLKNEGVRAFWKGNSPAELLYVAYGAVQFSTLRFVNHALRLYVPIIQNEQWRQVLAGGTAGSAATLATYPLDFLRTRVAANTSTKSTLLSTIRTTMKTEGLRGFYHGATATLISVFPYMGLFFATYSYVRDAEPGKLLPAWLPPVFTASSIASLSSKAAVYPLDTIRKRVQVHGARTMSETATAGYGERYSHNVFAAGRQIVAHEGVAGLYRGLGVSLLKSWPSSVLSIFLFEVTLNVMRWEEAWFA